jgi:hypothetical protein
MELRRYDAVAGVRKFEHLNAAVQASKLKVPSQNLIALLSLRRRTSDWPRARCSARLCLRCAVPDQLLRGLRALARQATLPVGKFPELADTLSQRLSGPRQLYEA